MRHYHSTKPFFLIGYKKRSGKSVATSPTVGKGRKITTQIGVAVWGVIFRTTIYLLVKRMGFFLLKHYNINFQNCKKIIDNLK